MQHAHKPCVHVGHIRFIITFVVLFLLPLCFLRSLVALTISHSPDLTMSLSASPPARENAAEMDKKRNDSSFHFFFLLELKSALLCSLSILVISSIRVSHCQANASKRKRQSETIHSFKAQCLHQVTDLHGCVCECLRIFRL